MIITDRLAQTLEMAEAVDAAGCAEAACRLDPECEAATKAIAGGYLTFCGSTSPFTHAIGVGMHGPVTLEEIREIEEFFKIRKAPVSIDVCPHSDASLREILSSRSYRMADINNVLVRQIRVDEEVSLPEGIRVTETSDETVFAETVTRGFFGRVEIGPEELQLGQLLFRMPCVRPYLCYIGDVLSGACGLTIRNGIANCFADATLPARRGQGAHRAMISHRIETARAAGCELMTAATPPGGVSQRNYQRLGFEIAYSKFTMVLE